MVGFRDLVGIGIAPVSKKTAVKGKYSIGLQYRKSPEIKKTNTKFRKTGIVKQVFW